MTTKTEYTPGQFCWVDLNAKDFDGMQEFYGELFGWELSAQPSPRGRYGLFTLDGDIVAGMGEMSAEMVEGGMPSVWNSYVATADCAASVARAKELGGEVLFDTYETPTGSGKLAFLQDREGAVFALWEAKEHIGAQRVNEPGSFSWNELATRDMEAATGFYGELFGWSWQEVPGPAPMAVCAVGDQMNGHALLMNEQWDGIPPNWAVYFAVGDTDVAVKQVEALGGKVMVPPMDIPQGRFAVVSDPGGAHFYVMKLANPG